MNAFIASLDNLYSALSEETGDGQLVCDFKLYMNSVFYEPPNMEITHPLHPITAYAQPHDLRGNRNRLWVSLTNAAPVYYENIIEYMFDRPDSDSYMCTTRLLRSWMRYADNRMLAQSQQ